MLEAQISNFFKIFSCKVLKNFVQAPRIRIHNDRYVYNHREKRKGAPMPKSASNTSLDFITCPGCGTSIPVAKVLQQQLTEQIREEYEGKAKLEKDALLMREAELNEKESALDRTKQDLDKQVQELLIEEKAKLAAELQSKAREEVEIDLQALREELQEKELKLDEAHRLELELRKKERALDDSKKALELDVARKIDAERTAIEEATVKRIAEERRLKDLEKDKQINDMLQQMEILKRKAEQGSQQLQGEVLELDLEAFFKEQFPFDDIQPVPKGMTGADLIQRVHTREGVFCGTIIWESKRTKAWSNGWIDKLKGDQRFAKAEIAVLATDALPKGIQNFGQKDGIWVTNCVSAAGLATALREVLIQVSRAKGAVEGKEEKMEVLFAYLTGPHFKQRVEAIMEAFNTLKSDLDEEKRVTTRRWAKREKQLERIVLNTAGMYGDLQGFIGSSLQSIPALESGQEEPEPLEQIGLL